MALVPWQATIQDEAGNEIFEPVLTVRVDGGSLASIFDINGTPIANPLTGAGNGFVQFMAEAGRYIIQAESAGVLSDTWVVDLAFAHGDSPTFENVTLNGVVSGSAVQSSPTDTGTGKLMKVGAFGLGGRAAALPNGDVDDIDAREIGIYRITPTDTNWTSPQPYAHIITMRQGGGINASEIAVDISGRLYTRGRTSGGVSKWRRYFHEDNAVGTVSQSAGVPTGAIIERGSNPNGEFVKYADGTQICWSIDQQIDLTDSAGTTSTVSAFTPPASFVGTPSTYGTISGEITGWEVQADRGRVSLLTRFRAGNVELLAFAITPLGGTFGVANILSIGRWY